MATFDDNYIARIFSTIEITITGVRGLVEAPYTPPDATPPLLLYNQHSRAQHYQTLKGVSKGLKRHLDQLHALKQQLADVTSIVHRRYAEIENAMAPVSALPTEIVLRVFHHAIKLPVHYSFGGQPPASVFAQVCRRWRSILLATPHCWSDFSFVDKARPRYPHAMLQKAVERSSGAPRTLCPAHSNRRWWEPRLLWDNEFLKTLQNSYIYSDSDTDDFDQLFSGDLHNLTTLTIKKALFDDSPPLDVERYYPNQTSPTPSLSSLTVESISIERLGVLGSTITFLHLFCVDIGDLWLQQNLNCPQLKYLSIIDCHWSGELPSITIPTLRNLEVGGLSSVLPLYTPNVRQITIRNGWSFDRATSELEAYTSQAPDVEVFTCDRYLCTVLIDTVTHLADHEMFPLMRNLIVSLDDGPELDDPLDYPVLLAALKRLITSPRRSIQRFVAPPKILDCDRQWFKENVPELVQLESYF